MVPDPYNDPERRNKRVNLTKVDGQIDDVTFSLTGPPDMVTAIVKYIRSLNRLMNNKLDG